MAYNQTYYGSQAAAESAAGTEFPAAALTALTFIPRASDHIAISGSFTVPASPYKVRMPRPLDQADITLTVGGISRAVVDGSVAASGQIAIDKGRGVWTFYSGDTGGTCAFNYVPHGTIVSEDFLHWLQEHLRLTQVQVLGLKDGSIAFTDLDCDGDLTVGGQVISEEAVLAPFTVASSVLVAGLNADLLDGYEAAEFLLSADYSTGVAEFVHWHYPPDILGLGELALKSSIDGNDWNQNGAKLDPAFIDGGVGATDHGALTGLADDDHTQYGLLAGRSGGQDLHGGTGAGDSLTLDATSDADKSGGIVLAADNYVIVPEVAAPGTSTAGTLNVWGRNDATNGDTIAVTDANGKTSGLGGGIVFGSLGSGESLSLFSTLHATKGGIYIAPGDWLAIPMLGSAPGTPASNFGFLYGLQGDKKIYFKDDTGTATDLTGGGGGGLGGSTGATDNALLRADGTGGSTVQASAISCDDSGNLTGVGTISSGNITSSGRVTTTSAVYVAMVPSGIFSSGWGLSGANVNCTTNSAKIMYCGTFPAGTVITGVRVTGSGNGSSSNGCAIQAYSNNSTHETSASATGFSFTATKTFSTPITVSAGSPFYVLLTATVPSGSIDIYEVEAATKFGF